MGRFFRLCLRNSRMGVGHDLGQQLRQWLAADPGSLRQPRALTNRLIDALGADDQLKGPLRDLASRPLLLEALHSEGVRRRSAVASLTAELSSTYAPAVLQELLDLILTATGEAEAAPITPPQPATPAPAQPAAVEQSLQRSLERFGPGLALAASGALVFAWLGAELDRALFDGWGWSGGVVLVLVLGLIQSLASGPLPGLRRRWALVSSDADQPRQAWRWLAQAWIHSNGLEAGLNLLFLLILLGNSPLQLGDVVLRYCLTSLACLGLAVLCAARWGVTRQWSGAAGAISAMVALAAGLSLLHWRVFSFSNGELSIPAWVLLLVYGVLQLGWQLPRQNQQEHSTPVQRLLSSSWGWGLLLGLFWAVITRVKELL